MYDFMDDEPNEFAGARILYIEDNSDNRMLVRRILMVEDFVVIEAIDGKSGIELAKREHPDLILMDMNLPEIDGYELTRRVREQIPELAAVPIIAMTANVMHGDREKTLEAGCDGYIPKPIDVDALPEQVKKFLKEARARKK
ncbi:MAG: response regulator [Anaerolineae bacterium]|jgi:two-component system cell cycle response regulator DivK|nr:response regulator [Anaerolineae bacterium]